MKIRHAMRLHQPVYSFLLLVLCTFRSVLFPPVYTAHQHVLMLLVRELFERAQIIMMPTAYMQVVLIADTRFLGMQVSIHTDIRPERQGNL